MLDNNCMKLKSLLLFSLVFLLCGCYNSSPNRTKSSSTGTDEDNVSITFEQHPYLMKSDDPEGYYFGKEIVAKTVLTFHQGHDLTQEEINSFDSRALNYVVPSLIGDGFWSFTFFMTNYDEKTNLATVYLRPQKLNHSINVYFGIYG